VYAVDRVLALSIVAMAAGCVEGQVETRVPSGAHVADAGATDSPPSCEDDAAPVTFAPPRVPAPSPAFARGLSCAAFALGCCFGDDGVAQVASRPMTVTFEPDPDRDRSVAHLERPPVETLSEPARACLEARLSRWELRPMLRGDVLVTPLDPTRNPEFPPASVVVRFRVAGAACATVTGGEARAR
jgi:hypothetical protein